MVELHLSKINANRKNFDKKKILSSMDKIVEYVNDNPVMKLQT